MLARRLVPALAVFALAASHVHADGPPNAKAPNPLAEFAEFKSVRSASMSPDGRTIACLVGVTDLDANRVPTELWLIPAAEGPPRKLALPTDAVEQVLWSPKGDRLALGGTERAKGEHCLWIVDVGDGASRRLIAIDRSNHYLAHQGANLCWSPDGASLAYLAADPTKKKADPEPLVVSRIQYKTRTAFSDDRRTHIWIVGADTGKARQLTSGAYDEHSIDWSPKGDEIVFCSNREPDPDANLNNDLFVVRVEDGAVHRLTKSAGNEMTPVWSPRGDAIAYTHTKRALTTIDTVAEDAHVWTIDRKSGATRELAAKLDRRCGQLRWSDDGSRVFCLAPDRGNRLLYRLDAKGSAAEKVFAVEGSVASYSLPSKGRGCCVLSTPVQAPEVYTFDPAKGEPVARTRFNADALARRAWVSPKRVECKSFDGTPIEGWLMVPPDATAEKKAPLILNIHGGPHSMHGNGFAPTFQTLCRRGYAILYLNPRGSIGYGQAFSDGCLNDWGGADYKDLLAGLDHALARHPELDRTRLGVTGGSYGGYMTNWAITQDDRFKAAVSYAGLSNLISFYATSLYQDLVHVEFGGMPWDRFDILWERSPLRHIKRAKTPTLILHGEADFDVHISQSEELYTALKFRGVETVFVRYPRQGHGATEPKQQLDMLERTVAWFDRYLQPAKRK